MNTHSCEVRSVAACLMTESANIFIFTTIVGTLRQQSHYNLGSSSSVILLNESS